MKNFIQKHKFEGLYTLIAAFSAILIFSTLPANSPRRILISLIIWSPIILSSKFKGLSNYKMHLLLYLFTGICESTTIHGASKTGIVIPFLLFQILIAHLAIESSISTVFADVNSDSYRLNERARITEEHRDITYYFRDLWRTKHYLWLFYSGSACLAIFLFQADAEIDFNSISSLDKLSFKISLFCAATFNIYVAYERISNASWRILLPKD